METGGLLLHNKMVLQTVTVSSVLSAMRINVMPLDVFVAGGVLDMGVLETIMPQTVLDIIPLTVMDGTPQTVIDGVVLHGDVAEDITELTVEDGTVQTVKGGIPPTVMLLDVQT